MEPNISVISLNIEGGKHFNLIKPFLEREKPDVFCVQELHESDIPFFENLAGKSVCFAPMALYPDEGNLSPMGIGIFSRLPARNPKTEYYYGGINNIINFERNGLGIMNRALVYCDVEKGGKVFRIGTTHFTWTPDGNPNDNQRRDLNALLGILDKAGEIVFMGDFNSPRGKETFSEISRKYKDNIPAKYETSIDAGFHRAGDLGLMVDGLFSTPGYEVTDAELVCGVSDHCAIKAVVQRHEN